MNMMNNDKNFKELEQFISSINLVKRTFVIKANDFIKNCSALAFMHNDPVCFSPHNMDKVKMYDAYLIPSNNKATIHIRGRIYGKLHPIIKPDGWDNLYEVDTCTTVSVKIMESGKWTMPSIYIGVDQNITPNYYANILSYVDLHEIIVPDIDFYDIGLLKLEFDIIKETANIKVYKYLLNSIEQKDAVKSLQKESDKCGEIGKMFPPHIMQFYIDNGLSDSGYTRKLEYASIDDVEIKIIGYSSLPKVDDVLDRIKSRKEQTTPGAILANAISQYVKDGEIEIPESTYIQKWCQLHTDNKERLLASKRKIIYALYDKKISAINFKGSFTDDFYGKIEGTIKVNIEQK